MSSSVPSLPHSPEGEDDAGLVQHVGRAHAHVPAAVVDGAQAHVARAPDVLVLQEPVGGYQRW